MNIITRFPPSPTGKLHIGRARTFLFNYLYTRQNGGKIVFRFEDTDKERSKKEYEENMLDALSWLGLTFDEGPFYQSKRTDIYKDYLRKILNEGKAYISKEEPTEEDKAEGRTRGEVVRFRNPNKRVSFTDLVRGEISFDTTDLKDFVIARSLDEPLYHLAVVIDDFLMGITHVIRGEDGISNTPRQILIQEAIGAPRPAYAHIPLILAPDRSKLAARHGALSVTEYRDKGFLSEALINYLALLGWNPGTNQEILSMEELIRSFDMSKVQKGGAIFLEEKLRWINKKHIERQGGPRAVLSHIPGALLEGRSENGRNTLAEVIFDRVSVYGDIKNAVSEGEYDYLLNEPKYPKELLTWKKATSGPRSHLEHILLLVGNIPEASFTKAAVRETLAPYADASGKGNVLWPFRVALSGKEQSPDPFSLAAILGKNITEERLRRALALL